MQLKHLIAKAPGSYRPCPPPREGVNTKARVSIQALSHFQRGRSGQDQCLTTPCSRKSCPPAHGVGSETPSPGTGSVAAGQALWRQDRPKSGLCKHMCPMGRRLLTGELKPHQEIHVNRHHLTMVEKATKQNQQLWVHLGWCPRASSLPAWLRSHPVTGPCASHCRLGRHTLWDTVMMCALSGPSVACRVTSAQSRPKPKGCGEGIQQETEGRPTGRPRGELVHGCAGGQGGLWRGGGAAGAGGS